MDRHKEAFYDRDVSAALNIRRCAVGTGTRHTELCYWEGRPARPKPGQPGQEWVYLPNTALLRKWRRPFSTSQLAALPGDQGPGTPAPLQQGAIHFEVNTPACQSMSEHWHAAQIGILVACAYFKNKEGAYYEQTVYVMTDGKAQSAAITQAAVNQVVCYLLAEHDMDMRQ
ncbi:hypothetical protein QJQ45_004695 [Haematococcus lacustris]|nr:hypothetical protein QJQ45_004695 [Haematococcus lacustris]